MLDTIYTKIRINGQVTPAEQVLVIRDMYARIIAMEERIDGLERSTNIKRTISKASKGKVSPPRVQPKSDE
jgi:hypothetical protein